MNCIQAKSDIALCVGNDLDEAAKKRLKRHLKECSPCHLHWKNMKSSLRVLHKRDDLVENSRHQSLWPILSVRLASRIKAQRANRFNGWLPAFAVVAACLLMVTFSVFYPAPQSTAIRPRTIITHPASASPWMGNSSKFMPTNDALIPIPLDRRHEWMLNDGNPPKMQPSRPPSSPFEF